MNAYRALIWGLLLAAGPAAAEGNGLGARVGSGGIALEYTHGLGERLDLRAGYALATYRDTFAQDDIDYEGEIQYGAALAMLDYRPLGGGFRLSAGAYSRAPEVDLVAEGQNEEYQVGNERYTATGRLDGDIDLGALAPYLGIGWGGSSAGTGFGLSFDVGVMFADAPSVSLAAQGRACRSTLVACDPADTNPLTGGFDVNDPSDPRAQAFRTELENEERNVEDEIADLRYWPVVSLGLHYRF